MRTHFRRKSDWIMFINTVVLFSAWIIGFYWYFWPYNVATFATPTILIENEDHLVKAGEPVKWLVDVVQHTNGVKVDTNIVLEDGITINFTPKQYTTKRGHQSYISASNVVPSYTPAGPYRLIVTSTFHVNPIRTITITRESEEFEVIKP